jgi:hypothetical protein
MNRRSRTSILLSFFVLAFSAGRPVDAPRAAATVPTFKYVREKDGGCHDLFFFKETADGLEVLWISADKEKLKLPAKGSATFDVAGTDGLDIGVDLWEKAPASSAYCNDIAPDAEKKSTWRATRGKLTITIWEPVELGTPGPKTYRASAHLRDATFEDGAGNRATLKEESITNVLVGWVPG